MNIELIIKVVVIIIIFIIIMLLIKQKITEKKEKRISFYSDKIKEKYMIFLEKNRKNIKKINYLNKTAKKYDKYIKYKNRDKLKNIDFITNKIVISILFLLLVVISSIFTTGISIIMLLINGILGYYLLDIFLYFYYKIQTKQIENELLRAIIVMNNAFKSGKSTLQALKIASVELPEPISDEFKKMYLDMKYGLSVDKVFERFAKRVNLEEATYLSSSLTILNKTGGNIVEVFSSIEKTLFDKKKLNEELKNISASPNMIIKVLFIIPIVFTLIIYILNPTYFKPLLSSTLGYMIIAIIIIMFIIYILLLRRIMKIDT